MGTTQNPTPMPPGAPPSGAPPSAMSPGVPHPPQKTNTLAWVLGGCGGALVIGIIVMVVSIRMYVRSHIHVASNGDVDISMGGATIHAGQMKDIGLPIYPGAETNSGKGVDISVQGKEQGMAMAVFTSSDPIEKVDAWYRENLNSAYDRQVGVRNHITFGGKDFPMENGSVAYISQSGDNMTMVALNPMMGKTQISLMRIGAAVKPAQ